MSTIAPKAPNPSASSRSNGPRRICVAYSGGLDTSCVIPWLREHYKCEVVAFVADVGQGKDELIGIEKKAKDSGACECYVADLREKFLTDFVWPMVMAGCTYEGRYLLGTSIARPCIAEAHVKAGSADTFLASLAPVDTALSHYQQGLVRFARAADAWRKRAFTSRARRFFALWFRVFT
jgi:tRNA(Ile)-lysidine synthase TilS/MesJ